MLFTVVSEDCVGISRDLLLQSLFTFILIKFLYFVAQCKAFFGKVSRYIALSLPSSQLLHCRGASAQLAIIDTVAIVIVIQKRCPPPHILSLVWVWYMFTRLCDVSTLVFLFSVVLECELLRTS